MQRQSVGAISKAAIRSAGGEKNVEAAGGRRQGQLGLTSFEKVVRKICK